MTALSRSASSKAGVLIAIAVLLLIPLGMLQSLVKERVLERDQAIASVAHGWGERQAVSGPVLAIPVTTDGDADHPKDWYVLPDQLNLTVELHVQETPKTVGSYSVPVYIAHVHAVGDFTVSQEVARFKQTGANFNVHVEQARMLLPVSDTRGVRSLVSAVPDAFQRFEPASAFPLTTLAAAMTNRVDLTQGPYHFDLTFEVAGTQALQFLPLAHSMRVHTHGNWADPGFTAGFLPLERHIDINGFTADWQVMSVNRSYGDRWLEGTVNDSTVLQSGFGVDLIQPVDIYQRATRAVKYGGLFIALSFMTLFLVETRQRRPLHPIQYGLMGLALSIFYLLLLALSEQIGFAGAYVAATVALCALMGLYLAGALRSRLGGAFSVCAFATTYALLYLLVTTESYALLAGSLVLFAILSIVMLLTRKVDWYAEDRFTAVTGSSSGEA